MFVWNQSKSGMVNLEKVRNFSIRPTASGIEVTAWFSDSETLAMGTFKNDSDAEDFLNKFTKNETHKKEK